MRYALGSFVFAQVLLAGVLGRCALAQAGGPSHDEAVVFIAPPGLGRDTVLALEEAVAAQVSLVGAKLVFLDADQVDSGLEERMSQAEELARIHHAVGVFWIDARPSGRWFLYIMDRYGTHIVVRPLSVESTSMDVAIEAAAVIAGSASDALLKQQSIEVHLAAPRPAQPVAPSDPDSQLRIELGYAGTIFAPREPWVSGLSIGGSWLWPSGPYLGLSYVWTPPLRIVDEATFQITRYPIAAHGGVRFDLGSRLAFGGELAVGVEFRTRTTTDTDLALATTDTSSRTLVFTGIRLAAEWRPLRWLGILLRASPELVLNGFDYEQQPAQPGKSGVTYLSPYLLRFTAQIGIAIVR